MLAGQVEPARLPVAAFLEDAGLIDSLARLMAFVFAADDAMDEGGSGSLGAVSAAALVPRPASENRCNNPCDCCGADERCKGNRYCADCKRALNNVTNNEKKEGQLDPARKARFEAVRKEAGAALHALIMAYRHQCSPSNGRGKSRGNIDSMRVLEHGPRRSSALLVSGWSSCL